jgi:hypothetical protein
MECARRTHEEAGLAEPPATPAHARYGRHCHLYMPDAFERIVAIVDAAALVEAPEIVRAERAENKRARRKPRPDQSSDDGGADDDGPRSNGFSVDELNKEYAVVMIGSQAVVFHEQPHARLVEHRRLNTWFRNRRTEVKARDAKLKA